MISKTERAARSLKMLQKTWRDHRVQFIPDVLNEASFVWEDSNDLVLRDVCSNLQYYAASLKEWDDKFSKYLNKQIKELEAKAKGELENEQ